MEFYKDELVFKNNTSYVLEKKEKEETKHKNHTALKIAIIAFILTFAPTMARGIKHSIQSSGKEYEFNERNEMYKKIVEKLKEMGVNNSITAIKYISNLINDGYLTTENISDEYYNIVGEYDYNTIIGNPTTRSNCEVITKIINMLFDKSEVEAHTVNVSLNDKTADEKNKYSEQYMVLVCDKQFKTNYLYWYDIDEFINIQGIINTFANDYVTGRINSGSEYITGNINLADIFKVKSNSNSDFHEVNFEIYKKHGNDLYSLTSNQLYDLNRSITGEKIKIELKEKNKRIPE